MAAQRCVVDDGCALVDTKTHRTIWTDAPADRIVIGRILGHHHGGAIDVRDREAASLAAVPIIYSQTGV